MKCFLQYCKILAYNYINVHSDIGEECAGYPRFENVMSARACERYYFVMMMMT